MEKQGNLMPGEIPLELMEKWGDHFFLWEEISPQAKKILGSDKFLLLLRKGDGLAPLASPGFPSSMIPEKVDEESLLKLAGERGIISGRDWKRFSPEEAPGAVVLYSLKLRDWQPGYLLVFYRKETVVDPERANPLVMAISYLLALFLLRQELARRTEDLSLLLKAANVIGSQLELDQTLDMILNSLASVAGVYTAAILIVDEGQNALRIRAQRGYFSEVTQIVIPLDKGITGRAATTGIIQVVNDVKSDPDYIKGAPGTVCEMAIPLKAEGRVIGVLDIESNQEGFFDAERQSLIVSLADQISLALYNSILYERTREMAITDYLTGLFNRRHFLELAQREVFRDERFGHPLCLAMIDIDHFKEYNDRYGHLSGDQALKDLAWKMKANCRKIDILARFGGEEFVILMPETDLQGGLTLASRLREIVQMELPITVSIGVASMEKGGSLSLEELLKRADLALYQAKEGGRNRVVAFKQD
ncbi:MAG: sensor domain-containing diguanylate cyclase [Caldiserica bacterium]|jgi:diguanylate cyclase (GGDEF)-like protein|nr:sensor domain-containing diguanylate cyclase [Caldisericota bacterium]MDH7562548.1 sensor domain-containing diguanylate cyclase [Caldisericota bacterium]